MRVTATFLSQRYDDTTVNCECIRCMEQEVHTVVPPDIWEDLGHITDVELYVTVK